MKNCLWEPSAARIQRSQLSQFLQQLDREQQRQFDNYADLHRWSVESPEAFWQSVWDFCDIRASQTSDQILVDGNQFPGARWFPDARLNFAENLLRNRSDKTALISRLENGRRETISYAGLYQQVSQLAQALRNAGVGRGDRVAGFMPNISETVIAMLASASIGAVWSSCSPDFGINGVMDRFGQIQPKVRFKPKSSNPRCIESRSNSSG